MNKRQHKKKLYEGLTKKDRKQIRKIRRELNSEILKILTESNTKVPLNMEVPSWLAEATGRAIDRVVENNRSYYVTTK